MEQSITPSLKHILECNVAQNAVRLQQKSSHQRFFNLSLVVAAHVGIAAMLLLTVREFPLIKASAPPVYIAPPLPPTPPPVERSRALPPAPRTITNTTPQFSEPTITTEVPTVSTQETPTIIGDPSPMPTDTPSIPSGNSGGGTTVTPDASVVCSNVAAIQSYMRYPPQARRDGLQGEVMVRFILSATGEVKQARVLTSTPSVLNRAALNAVQQFQCTGQGRDIAVDAPFNFRLSD
jgi:periplasmic protein TonB